MQDGQCPKCGAHEVFVSTWPGGVSDGSQSGLYVVTDSGDPRDEGRYFACVACGYVEHYLDENVRARIAATPSGRTWSKVVPAGWYDDPTGRHAKRRWSGQRWTAEVEDDGVVSEDPESI